MNQCFHFTAWLFPQVVWCFAALTLSTSRTRTPAAQPQLTKLSSFPETRQWSLKKQKTKWRQQPAVWAINLLLSTERCSGMIREMFVRGIKGAQMQKKKVFFKLELWSGETQGQHSEVSFIFLPLIVKSCTQHHNHHPDVFVHFPLHQSQCLVCLLCVFLIPLCFFTSSGWWAGLLVQWQQEVRFQLLVC